MLNNSFENQLKEMYSSAEENINKIHLNELFPDIHEGCINFGYWENCSEIITLEERIISQKALYQKLFSLFKPKAKQTVLEIGSGRGHAVNWLHNNEINCFGIDALTEQIIKSQKRYPKLKKYFLQGLAENIPFDDNIFDSVYSLEVAQHFFSFKHFAKESFRILKKNGIVCISSFFFVSEKFTKFVHELIPSSIEGTHNAISIDQAILFLKDAGFVIEYLESIGANVFPQYAKWQQQKFQNQCNLKSMAKEQKWESYYTGGGLGGEHPWSIVFRNNWIDYYIIKAVKR